jgi:hypothetical protein
VLTAVAAAALGGAASAEATFRGDDGKIFFVSDRDGDYEVYSMNPDGSDQTNLTGNSVADGHTGGNPLDDLTMMEGPSLSPDGQHVAYTSMRSGNRDIWVMDADGGDNTQLTTDPGADYFPAFTATGEIAFLSDRDAPGVPEPNLWRMAVDGSGQAPILPAPGTSSSLLQPDAHPDPGLGFSAFAGTVGEPGESRLDLVTENNGRIVLTQGPADLTPEFGIHPQLGLQIYLAGNPNGSDYDIYRMSGVGGPRDNLTQTPGLNEFDPAPAPEGVQLAWARLLGDLEIAVFNGETIGAVTQNDAHDFAPEWQPVDVIAPGVQIDSGPGLTNDPRPTFTFSSGDPSASFRCSIDEGGDTIHFVPCRGADGSHQPSAALAEGTYTFRVQATDSAGNVGEAATREFTVDTQGPVVTITRKPKATIRTDRRKVTVRFEFSASEPGSTFTCAIDGGPAEDCDGQAEYRLGRGAHTFEVRATDAASNEGPVASHSFKIVRR